MWAREGQRETQLGPSESQHKARAECLKGETDKDIDVDLGTLSKIEYRVILSSSEDQITLRQ
jgi:hypothetical protein